MAHLDFLTVATEYMQIWNAGNDGLLDKFATPGIVVEYTHFEKVYRGIEEYKAMLKMTHQFFPDLKIAIKEILLSEDKSKGTVLWEYSGTHKTGNLFGIDASGKKVNVNGITILETEGGLVRKEKGIVDNLTLIMQLGALKN